MMEEDNDLNVDPIQDNCEAELDGWGDPVAGAVGGEWPQGAGWGPGGPPNAWNQHNVAPANNLNKGDGDSGCGTDSEEDMEEEDRFHDDEHDVLFAEQITPAQYEKQKADYTKSAVNALLQSPEYQRKYKSCQSCWCLWLEGHCRQDCLECGGFSLVRPCPICTGKCGKVWKRNIDMSHSQHEAHWDGECGLPLEEQQAYMLQNLTDPDEEAILDGMMDLNTGTWSS